MFFYFKTYLRYFVQINQLPPEVRAKSKDYVLWRLISQCDILPFRASTEKFCLLLCILSSILSRYISPSPPLFPVYPEREGRREERKRETREGGRLHEVVKTKLQFSVICSFIVNLLKDHLSMSVASSIMTRQLYPAGPPRRQDRYTADFNVFTHYSVIYP